MNGPIADAYAAASRFFVEVVDMAPDESWSSPALGSWSLRDLVGHANRSHTGVEEYLEHPVEPEPRGSVWFSAEAIAARAREAAAALGDDPKRTIAETSKRVLAIVAQTPADAQVGSPNGTMSLSDYLTSRIAELTIHTLDVAKALGVDKPAPTEALDETLRFVSTRIVRRGDGETVVLALSGRGSLPPGYSIY